MSTADCSACFGNVADGSDELCGECRPLASLPAVILARAVRIADESETSVIECACDWIDEAGARWYDLASGREGNEPESIDWPVAYLRSRGLVEDHPTRPDFVRLLFLSALSVPSAVKNS